MRTSAIEPEADHHLLIVEDEQPIVTWIRACLIGRGWSVRSAATTDETLQVIEQEPEWPDVVLVDLNLQGEPGLPLIDRALERCPGANVIASSGFASAEAQHELARRGVTFLQKPFPIEDLVAALGR